jgi:transposase-like protein
MDCSISSRERFPSAKLPRDLAERKNFREQFREFSANKWRKSGEKDKGVTPVRDDARAVKPSFSEMGKRSAAARRSPEHEKLKAEAIRLHVELDYGINAISPRIGINKISIRRWLIAAGCYRAGHRTTRVKNDGARLVAYKASDLGRKQIYVHVWQRRAWADEWKGVARWDEARHWHRHPAKQNYINVRSARIKRASSMFKICCPPDESGSRQCPPIAARPVSTQSPEQSG